MNSSQEIAIFWFRRDLRWEDNHGFYQALNSGLPVLPLFIFDQDILDKLDDKKDQRLQFIHYHCRLINDKFCEFGSGLKTIYGKPLNVWEKIIEEYNVRAVYTNHDYEPYAITRDMEVQQFLYSNGVEFHSFKDQVIFEKGEVVKADGKPYTIFTPYSKVWKAKLAAEPIHFYPSEDFLSNLYKFQSKLISLEQLGFERSDRDFSLSGFYLDDTIKNYHDIRNIPSNTFGTTRLSVHLRFGTVSIRKLVKLALPLNETWLNELIWREFFMQILYHFPKVVNHSFKEKYDKIPWRNNENEFKRWCQGRTGYPIVDAGMRELNETGFMHNRVRMIVASFFTKHLLIDWRWGEAYFAEKLLDYELSANNGNWQWAAGTGCDAAPYFRVFNPSEQTKKFDSEAKYINKWLSSEDLMTPPMVEHSFARKRALDAYKNALHNGE
ncbi:MAG: cryptochrome/photolyase family protein [Chitinophagales bacterium]